MDGQAADLTPPLHVTRRAGGWTPARGRRCETAGRSLFIPPLASEFHNVWEKERERERENAWTRGGAREPAENSRDGMMEMKST